MPARLGRAVVVALAAAALAGCVTTLEREARRARETGTDPLPLVERLTEQHRAIDTTKRVFDVTLIEGRRRFAGAGAVEYRADPRRLAADVFGPHDTHVLAVRLEGDRLTVRLPREGEVLTGELGDPRFAALTGERALVSPEILGALVGAYDVGRLAADADWMAAAADGERRTLYVQRGEILHAFTVEPPGGRLVEYRQARTGRLVYRVQFDDFQAVGGRESPRHVVLRDYVQERRLVIDVTREHEEVTGV
ncbi:MAG TPA: hypothetical protein VJP59_10560 [Gemmatimonadota bacterium]|nr:hypothetical protein [Gemmatimonadota bacterium]